jgi:hypothetical protein
MAAGLPALRYLFKSAISAREEVLGVYIFQY